MNRKLIWVLIAALLCLLPGCGKGGDKAEELPAEYSFDGETISALTTEDEGVQFAQAKTVTYHYNGLSASSETAYAYVTQLSKDGFTVVDEGLVQTSLPDFTTEEGTVRLAKNLEREEEEEDGKDAEEEETEDGSAEDGSAEDAAAEGASTEAAAANSYVVLIVLNWSEGSCSVTLDEQEGMVIFPETDKTGSTAASGITLTGALDYLRELPPSVLGLTGDTMEGYHVYAMDGIVMVDGQSCLRLQVYSTDNPSQTNILAGSYLMTSDGKHLYRLDEIAGTVEELEMPR